MARDRQFELRNAMSYRFDVIILQELENVGCLSWVLEAERVYCPKYGYVVWERRDFL
jgi:hypothetical protein